MLEVVVGLIEDARGRVLVNQRQTDKPLAGQWEFPGGKRSPGEDGRAALERELAEELGIRVTAARRWLTIRHDYPDLSVRLEVWRIDAYRGRPEPRERQRLAWHAPGELREIDLLAADLPIVDALVGGSAAPPATEQASSERPSAKGRSAKRQ